MQLRRGWVLRWTHCFAAMSLGLVAISYRDVLPRTCHPDTRRHWPVARIPSRSSGAISLNPRILSLLSCASTKTRSWIDLGVSSRTTSTRISSAGRQLSWRSSSRRASLMIAQAAAAHSSSYPWTPPRRPTLSRFLARPVALTSSGAIPRRILRPLTSVLTSQPPSTKTSPPLLSEPKHFSPYFPSSSSLSRTATIARRIKRTVWRGNHVLHFWASREHREVVPALVLETRFLKGRSATGTVSALAHLTLANHVIQQ